MGNNLDTNTGQEELMEEALEGQETLSQNTKETHELSPEIESTKLTRIGQLAQLGSISPKARQMLEERQREKERELEKQLRLRIEDIAIRSGADEDVVLYGLNLTIKSREGLENENTIIGKIELLIHSISKLGQKEFSEEMTTLLLKLLKNSKEFSQLQRALLESVKTADRKTLSVIKLIFQEINPDLLEVVSLLEAYKRRKESSSAVKKKILLNGSVLSASTLTSLATLYGIEGGSSLLAQGGIGLALLLNGAISVPNLIKYSAEYLDIKLDISASQVNKYLEKLIQPNQLQRDIANNIVQLISKLQEYEETSRYSRLIQNKIEEQVIVLLTEIELQNTYGIDVATEKAGTQQQSTRIQRLVRRALKMRMPLVLTAVMSGTMLAGGTYITGKTVKEAITRHDIASKIDKDEKESTLDVITFLENAVKQEPANPFPTSTVYFGEYQGNKPIQALEPNDYLIQGDVIPNFTSQEFTEIHAKDPTALIDLKTDTIILHPDRIKNIHCPAFNDKVPNGQEISDTCGAGYLMYQFIKDSNGNITSYEVKFVLLNDFKNQGKDLKDWKNYFKDKKHYPSYIGYLSDTLEVRDNKKIIFAYTKLKQALKERRQAFQNQEKKLKEQKKMPPNKEAIYKFFQRQLIKTTYDTHGNCYGYATSKNAFITASTCGKLIRSLKGTNKGIKVIHGLRIATITSNIPAPLTIIGNNTHEIFTVTTPPQAPIKAQSNFDISGSHYYGAYITERHNIKIYPINIDSNKIINHKFVKAKSDKKTYLGTPIADKTGNLFGFTVEGKNCNIKSSKWETYTPCILLNRKKTIK